MVMELKTMDVKTFKTMESKTHVAKLDQGTKKSMRQKSTNHRNLYQ